MVGLADKLSLHGDTGGVPPCNARTNVVLVQGGAA
jgi:hypothetical protein